MLGRLAKWLRLMGYDTAYARQESDPQIAAQARAQGRIVLTRDRELARHRGIQSLLIASQDLEEQLGEVIAAVGLPPEGRAARCPRCNVALVEVPREEARPHVPPYVYRTQEAFTRCTRCGRFYWAGTHWQNIEQKIAGVLDKGSAGGQG
jgi:uncharacterized protein with PIN domain